MNNENDEQVEHIKNYPSNPLILPQRHGCVTVWLTLLLIFNSFFMLCEFMNFIRNEFLWINLFIVFFYIANIIFALMLLRWKKFGFWGFCGTSLISFICNFYIGFGFKQSFYGLIGIMLLYFILQIKKNNVTAWKTLE